MKKLTHWARWVGGAALLAIGGVTLLVKCDDPREDESVTVVTSCAPDAGVFERLSTDPSSPQSTVVAYVNAAESLAAKVAEMDNLLRDGCNDVDTALNIPTGSDPESACQPLAQVITTIRKTQPLPPGPPPPSWFGISFAPSCHVDPNALAACLNTCSVSDAGACDNSHCSPATQSAGTCNGTCIGTCTTTATGDASVDCRGECQGTCSNFGPDGGPISNLCGGECNGVCPGSSYNGYCATGCGNASSSSKLFTGECDGTCTGTCNGTVVNGGIPDGGLGPEAGVPNNSDGDCTGLCVGWCSSNAYGGCPFPCAGAPSFKGGVCTNPCSNTCVSGTGGGCGGTCDGVCVTATGDAGAPCSGICNGVCSGTVSSPICNGGLACGQNIECNNACTAAAAATVTCDPPASIEVEAVSRLDVYNALKSKGAKIGEALQMLSILRTAEGYVDQRSLTDFAAVGATGELVRACAARGQTAVEQANAGITAAIAANPTSLK